MAINESKIIDAICSMNPHGNEEGIIDAFGVYLTNHYADYYNRISYRFEKEFTEKANKIDKDLVVLAKSMLIEAGHVCGFNTFAGIRKSDAWKSIIAPMCNSKEDEIRGLVAVLNALGWGKWKVISVSKNKLIIQSKNTYESIGFLKEFGKSKHSECYLATGVVASFMNIVYQDNIYEDINSNAFHGKETKCRSKGDPICEIVVTRLKK